jgi:hypothetical protein
MSDGQENIHRAEEITTEPGRVVFEPPGYFRVNASSSKRTMSVHPLRCPSTAFGGRRR